MTQPLLDVTDLRVRIGAGDAAIRPVDGVSFHIRRGETFALLGESGCGKSMTALALLRLLPQPGGQITGGSVKLDGEELMALPETGMRSVRGGRIAMIFQEPMTSLNPVMTVGAQIEESLQQHQGLRGAAARQRVVELLDAVGIPDAARRYGEYPHQLSGGMKQRVMIAIALAGDPDLLIADEPTTALDVTIQAQVLELIKQLQRERGMAVLLITHDLGVVSGMADHVAVMYAGQIVEQAPREAFFEQPRHPYSRMLFSALPDSSKREARLAVIPGTVPALNQEFQGCRFAGRCDRGWAHCERAVPDWFETGSETGVRCHLADPQISAPGSRAEQAERATGQQVYGQDPAQRAELLQVDGLKVFFPIHKGFFKRVVGHVRAVDDVSIRIPRGQTLALVGESGCGKTTAGKAILQLLDAHQLSENTLVMVVSEQGNSLPFAKWTCYDNGLQSAFIARWPGRIQPGSVNPAMIEYVDILPTFVEVAGGTPDPVLDGKSLLPVGVVGVSGSFRRGDVVNISGPGGTEIGRGLAEYSDQEASRIVGCRSEEIEEKLGYRGRAEMVHRDDLVLFDKD